MGGFAAVKQRSLFQLPCLVTCMRLVWFLATHYMKTM